MKTMDRLKPVLVTGGTGYLASWIVKQLLDQGYEVRTTVKSLAQKDKYAHLTALAVKSTGILQFFEADLLKKESFADAMAGCELVVHTASPIILSNCFPMESLKNLNMGKVANVIRGSGLVISRFLTKYVLKKYRPTPVDVLAAKMISLSLDQQKGFRIVEGLKILK